MNNARNLSFAGKFGNTSLSSTSRLEVYTINQKVHLIGKFKGVRQAILLYDGPSRKYCYKLYISTDKQMLGFEIDEKLPANYQTRDHLDYMFSLYDRANLDSAPTERTTFENMTALVQKIYLS